MKQRPAMLLIGLLLAGCGSLRPGTSLPPPGSMVRPVAAAPPAPGAIFSAGSEMALFEDLRAHRSGDLVTIVLRESTSASKSATTKTSKESIIDLPGPTLAGRPVTVNGTAVLDNSLGGEREFEGAGSSSQSNQLTGNITAVVVERLANGSLVVRGEKWLRLNQGDEYVQVTGIIRPWDIGPDNTVQSDRVADARISYGGRGAVASSNRHGWLDRFFNSGFMPY